MKIPVGPSSFPHACNMPRPFCRPSFDHPSDIQWGGQIVKLLITQFYPASCYYLPIRPKYLPQHPILEHSQGNALLLFWETEFHTHTKQQANL